MLAEFFVSEGLSTFLGIQKLGVPPNLIGFVASESVRRSPLFRHTPCTRCFLSEGLSTFLVFQKLGVVKFEPVCGKPTRTP